jgi:internalin A
MASQPELISRPRRRLSRGSAWGLIIFVLVIGVWTRWLVQSARIQRRAVAAIQSGGGAVAYDWARTNGKWKIGGEPSAPRWLVNLFGVDYFGHCTAVFMGSPTTSPDPALGHVGLLTGLQELHLFGSSVGDAELVQLRRLSGLRYLVLNDTQVTDAGLEHLKGMTNLVSLELRKTPVTDAGLLHLKKVTNLSRLDLRDTRVTDAGLEHLKGMSNLSSLSLNDTQVTKAGIDKLKRSLPSVEIDH